MIKKISVVALFALFSFQALATFVGEVNIQKVLVTVKQGKAVRAKLKKTFDAKQKKLKKEEAKIRKMQQDFQKQSLVMNKTAKIKREKDIQARIMKLQKHSMEYQKDIQSMERKMKEPILGRIRKIIDKVSKKAGVDMTFESSTAPIVYAKNKKDLTDQVIKLYDKIHKK